MSLKDSLLWAAGFVDGEGCFSASFVPPKTAKARGYYHLTLSVSQTLRPPLETLQSLFGGSIAPMHGTGRNKDFWAWTVATRQARLAAERLHPHLQVKAPQAAIFVSWPLMSGGNGFKPLTRTEQDLLVKQLQMLNKRGK